PCAQLLGLGMRFLDLRLQLGAAALELLAGARDTQVLAGAVGLVRARATQVQLDGVDAPLEPAQRLPGGCNGLRPLRARLAPPRDAHAPPPRAPPRQYARAVARADRSAPARPRARPRTR